MRYRSDRVVHTTLSNQETQQFTTAVNPKSFKILFDSLYSDKILAVVRELCTNAWDSHVEAGSADQPFDIHLPTPLEPQFSVRDYGVSMDHNTVMHLYTTVFRSTKDETDTLVGQMGLGSKSPFAYTDSFTVTAWKHGRERSYLASIPENGIPTIAAIGDTKSSEPTGIQVSFPVHKNDITRFLEATQKVALGFDLIPNCNVDLEIEPPAFQHANWAIYPYRGRGDYSSKTYIRQGCVLYKVDAKRLVGHGYKLVVTVPIGTCEVAASRESLAFDARTTGNVEQVLDSVREDIIAYLTERLAACKTQYEAVRLYSAITDLRLSQPGASARPVQFYWKGIEPYAVLLDKEPGNPLKDVPEECVPEVHDIDDSLLIRRVNAVQRNGRWILDHPHGSRKVPRRRLRLKKLSGSEPIMRVIAPTPCQMEHLKQLLHLNDADFTKVEDLPDVEVKPKTKRVNQNSNNNWRGVYNVDTLKRPEILPDNFAYIVIDGTPYHNQHVRVQSFAISGRAPWTYIYTGAVAKYLFGFEPDLPVMLVTSSARKRLGLSRDRCLTEVWGHGSVWTPDVDPEKFRETPGFKKERVEKYFRTCVALRGGSFFSEIHQASFEWLTEKLGLVPMELHTAIGNTYRYRANLHESLEVEMRKEMEVLRRKYPMVFRNPSETDIRNYVRQVDREGKA